MNTATIHNIGFDTQNGKWNAVIALDTGKEDAYDAFICTGMNDERLKEFNAIIENMGQTVLFEPYEEGGIYKITSLDGRYSLTPFWYMYTKRRVA